MDGWMDGWMEMDGWMDCNQYTEIKYTQMKINIAFSFVFDSESPIL